MRPAVTVVADVCLGGRGGGIWERSPYVAETTVVVAFLFVVPSDALLLSTSTWIRKLRPLFLLDVCSARHHAIMGRLDCISRQTDIIPLDPCLSLLNVNLRGVTRGSGLGARA